MLAYYRSATIIPFLFFATVLGVARLARSGPAKGALIAFMAALFAANAAIWLT
jgi:hypothetical protein